MYASDPIPRPAGPPASVTPLQDHLGRVRLGVDDGYVVLPRSLAEAMPLPWQRQMAYLLGELHRAYGHLPWPVYRVIPSRSERLVDLDESQLAEAGYLVEIDGSGEFVYTRRDGSPVPDPESVQVLVSCVDPIPRTPPPPPQTRHPPPCGP